jgi:hypothetical protein
MSQSVESFAEIMAGVRRSAVHLELRDSYGVPNETDNFAAFRRGEWNEAKAKGDRHVWLDLVSDAVGRGVAMRRARVVSVPVTDCIRFEHTGTRMNIDAGEQVRWLPRRQASRLRLPGNDFWLFDDRLLQFNIFDGPGSWAHTDFTEDSDVVEFCSAAFDAVWQLATPHIEFRI